jgi:hypothetical protein
LLPLVAFHEEMRPWHYRREFACLVRRILKTRRFFFLDDDEGDIGRASLLSHG